MKTQIELSGDNFIIECQEGYSDILTPFIAAVSTGSLTIKRIRTRYPDSKLFEDIPEHDYQHSYEVLEEARPTFASAKPLKGKSELLTKLEAKAKAASKKEAA